EAAITFTPADNGTYTATFTVTDDDGDSSSDVAVVTVANVAPTVEITAAPTSGAEGAPVSVGSKATDPAGAAGPPTYKSAVTRGGTPFVLPPGTPTGGATFTFTPTDQGDYAVTLTVTDGDGGSATTSVAFAVANVAPAPVIDSVSTPRQEGTAITATGS